MVTLYLIRHGITDLNKPGIFFGNTDEDLNRCGVEQCRILGDAMGNIELDAVLSSPMKRCMHTASYICSKKGLQVYSMDELREMNFGTWEGKQCDEIAGLYPKDWEQVTKDWRNMSPTQGESFHQFYNRVSHGLDKIIDGYSGKKVAVITHSGCMRIIVSILLKLNEDGFWNFYFEHGKYSMLEIEEDHCTVKKINSIE